MIWSIFQYGSKSGPRGYHSYLRVIAMCARKEKVSNIYKIYILKRCEVGRGRKSRGVKCESDQNKMPSYMKVKWNEIIILYYELLIDLYEHFLNEDI